MTKVFDSSAGTNSEGGTGVPQQSGAGVARPREALPAVPTGHEQVVFCHDEASGLKAIIAIYSTTLGPALGGTRFYPYGSRTRRSPTS